MQRRLESLDPEPSHSPCGGGGGGLSPASRTSSNTSLNKPDTAAFLEPPQLQRPGLLTSPRVSVSAAPGGGSASAASSGPVSPSHYLATVNGYDKGPDLNRNQVIIL